MYESAKGRNNMILDRYILKYLGINLQLSDHVIEWYDRIFKESTSPMVHLGTYTFKDLNTRKITPEEFFMCAYA